MGNALSLTALLVAATTLTSCGRYQSVLNPEGPRAGVTTDLWWVLLTVGSVVYLGVIVLLGYALFRRRSDADGERPPGSRDGQTFVIAAGVAMPIIVLSGIFIYATGVLRDISEPSDDPTVTIEITGNRWWWEAYYPDYGFETANEIHIPAGTDVQIYLNSPNVIHSFWVPELSGKTDLIPGHTTDLWLRADKPGVYRGQCAEFCGIAHAHMALHVVADTPGDFEQWAAMQRGDGVTPTGEREIRGAQLFATAGCAECHAIRGVSEKGELGPDLTHLASREWIAAGTLDLNAGNLTAWIVEPQKYKPGVLMPAFDLTGEELVALVEYLLSLE